MYSVSLQGLADNFYDAKQLLPETFKKVCEDVNYPLNLRMHEVSTCHVVGGGSSSVVGVDVVVLVGACGVFVSGGGGAGGVCGGGGLLLCKNVQLQYMVR
jgi:hypothetical protein